jgi:hypothetical protein
MYRSAKDVLADNRGAVVAGVAVFAALWSLLLHYQPADSMSPGVLLWWTALCIVSLVNVCAWRHAAAALARRKGAAAPAVYLFQRRQLLLSAVFVLGCAFRSVLPRADVQRIGLFDSWISSVMLGRSVATVAELCFVAQWALFLHKVARDAGAQYGVVLAWLLVPLIGVAEMCSWHAVLTTSYLGNAVEESIWAFCAALVTVSFVALWRRCSAAYRPLLAVVMVLGVAYVTFMCTVDIPMYVSRWLADEATGREYLSVAQGLADVASRLSVTLAWDEWRTEIPWMSLYFSVGVWCSIAIIHAPRLEREPQLGSLRVLEFADAQGVRTDAGFSE